MILDEACKQHDKVYERLGKEAYCKYNSADSDLLRNSADIPGISGHIVRGVFKAKKALLPHMPRTTTQKNWPQILRYNASRPRTASTTTTPASIPRDSPMNEAMEDLSIDSQSEYEEGEPSA